jgi:hypothetical protein
MTQKMAISTKNIAVHAEKVIPTLVLPFEIRMGNKIKS